LAAVAIGTINTHPAPGAHGKGFGIALALAVFSGGLVLAIGNRFVDRSLEVQAAALVAMGAAGVALAALQPRGATELAAGAAVWMAVARLPLRLGALIAVTVIFALAVALALAGES
jgi:hypothetical protein